MSFIDWLFPLLPISAVKLRPDVEEGCLPLEAAYVQLNSYSCGVTAIATVLAYLKGGVDVSDLYARLDPPEDGMSNGDLSKEFARQRLQVFKLDKGFTPGHIQYQLARGRPVVAGCISSGDPHYVVIYGVVPEGYYVANMKQNWHNSYFVSWREWAGMSGPEFSAMAVGKKRRTKC